MSFRLQGAPATLRRSEIMSKESLTPSFFLATATITEIEVQTSTHYTELFSFMIKAPKPLKSPLMLLNPSYPLIKKIHRILVL
jgi:hypothetical protein